VGRRPPAHRPLATAGAASPHDRPFLPRPRHPRRQPVRADPGGGRPARRGHDRGPAGASAIRHLEDRPARRQAGPPVGAGPELPRADQGRHRDRPDRLPPPRARPGRRERGDQGRVRRRPRLLAAHLPGRPERLRPLGRHRPGRELAPLRRLLRTAGGWLRTLPGRARPPARRRPRPPPRPVRAPPGRRHRAASARPLRAVAGLGGRGRRERALRAYGHRPRRRDPRRIPLLRRRDVRRRRRLPPLLPPVPGPRALAGRGHGPARRLRRRADRPLRRRP
jgi:hypothetical protein